MVEVEEVVVVVVVVLGIIQAELVIVQDSRSGLGLSRWSVFWKLDSLLERAISHMISVY